MEVWKIQTPLGCLPDSQTPGAGCKGQRMGYFHLAPGLKEYMTMSMSILNKYHKYNVWFMKLVISWELYVCPY